jgi:G3E family GTPase
VQQQIAFADVILLNKIDLVPPEEIDKLEAKIKSMNSTCQIHRTQNSEIDLNRILEVRGFSLDRVLDIDPTFLDGELPFEWGGIYHLKPGEHQLMLRSGPNPSLDLMLFPVGGTDAAMLESAAKFAAQHFADPPGIVEVGDSFSPGNEPQALLLSKAENRFTMQIEREAFYALFTQHQPAEFQLTLQREGTVLDAAIHREFGSHHEHNEAVKSVGITLSGDLNPNKLNAWFQKLMAERGPDIYRMKGVLSIAGDEQRFVFQGVHMLLDARPDRPWGRDPRSNKLIFIGKNLNREELTEGFRKCLV